MQAVCSSCHKTVLSDVFHFKSLHIKLTFNCLPSPCAIFSSVPRDGSTCPFSIRLKNFYFIFLRWQSYIPHGTSCPARASACRLFLQIRRRSRHSRRGRTRVRGRGTGRRLFLASRSPSIAVFERFARHDWAAERRMGTDGGAQFGAMAAHLHEQFFIFQRIQHRDSSFPFSKRRPASFQIPSVAGCLPAASIDWCATGSFILVHFPIPSAPCTASPSRAGCRESGAWIRRAASGGIRRAAALRGTRCARRCRLLRASAGCPSGLSRSRLSSLKRHARCRRFRRIKSFHLLPMSATVVATGHSGSSAFVFIEKIPRFPKISLHCKARCAHGQGVTKRCLGHRKVRTVPAGRLLLS